MGKLRIDAQGKRAAFQSSKYLIVERNRPLDKAVVEVVAQKQAIWLKRRLLALAEPSIKLFHHAAVEGTPAHAKGNADSRKRFCLSTKGGEGAPFPAAYAISKDFQNSVAEFHTGISRVRFLMANVLIQAITRCGIGPYGNT